MSNPNFYSANPPGYYPPGQQPPQQSGPPAYGAPPGQHVMGMPGQQQYAAPPPGQQQYAAPPPGQQQYAAPPPGQQQYAAPPPGQFSPPMGGMPQQYGAPIVGPPSYAPPSMGPPGGMPMGANMGMGIGGPPTSSAMPPQSQLPPAQPPKSVQFFNVATGAPTPVAGPPPGGPPASAFGGMPPPPSGPGGVDNTMAPPASAMGYQGIPPPPSMGMGAMPPVAEPQSYVGQYYGGYPPPTQSTAIPNAFEQPGFGPGGPGAPMGQAPHGAPAGQGWAEGNQGPGAAVMNTLPALEEMDTSVQCKPQFLRPTTGKFLYTQGAANMTKVPLGIICQPMAGDEGIENKDVDVVDFGSTEIVRCKKCRTYINPYVGWLDNGRRWRCNICGVMNDTPTSYFSHLDTTGQRRDKDQRPELCNCSVEFIAPADYMVRPPVPPVYFFVIDVTTVPGVPHMLQNCVNAIKASLDTLPGTPRTQVGIITFDSSIHFYNLKSTLQAPQMLVVSDVNDIIMPLPEDLLVNLQDSRNVINSLLDSIPVMFANNPSISNCMGPALMAAKKIMQNLGGKLLLFQTSLPNLGEGALKQRDNPRLIGTDKEQSLLNPEEQWYKTNALDFNRLQICIDTFLFSGQYTDIATFTQLSKLTGGSMYYYPGFNGPRDGTKFESELTKCLTRSTAFEAVMRIRATRGVKVANFYGNHFIRGQDLLSLPNCTSDSTFGFDFAYEEPQLTSNVITVQAALLYTSSNGERRIRVHTMIIPVTHSVPEFLESVDIDTAVNLLSKQAVEISYKNGLENARSRIHQTCVDMLRASRGGGQGGPQYGAYNQPQQQQPQTPQQIPASLTLLPLYALSLQKCLALRGGNDVRIDERSFYMQLLLNMNIDDSRIFIYPRMFSIHDMGERIGIPSDSAEDLTLVAGPNRVLLPAIVNLSHERLASDGIFLLETGYDLFMWIGRAVNPAILNTLFQVQSLESIDMTQLKLHPDSSDFSARVSAVVEALRSARSRYMQLHFIREGDGYAEAYFARYLMEDRANFPGGTFSYAEYFSHASRQASGGGM